MPRFQCDYIKTRPARQGPGDEDLSRPIHEAQMHIVIAKDEDAAKQKMSDFINEPQPPGHSRSWEGKIRLIREVIPPLPKGWDTMEIDARN